MLLSVSWIVRGFGVENCLLENANELRDRVKELSMKTKSNEKLRTVIAVCLGLMGLQTMFGETITLTTAWSPNPLLSEISVTKRSRTINLKPGQTAKVLHFYSFEPGGGLFSSGPEPSDIGILEIKIANIEFQYSHGSLFGDFGEFSTQGVAQTPSTEVVGPGTIRLIVDSEAGIDPSFSDGAALCTIEVDGVAEIKLTEEAAFTPAGVPEIAVDADGPVTVQLESSVDMKKSWQTAEPGTYGGSANKRFFRMRIEKK